MDVVVVGAGVSGLSTAYTLKKKKAPETSVLVTEARDRVGGNIQSKSDGTYVWEEGPNSYQPGDAILTLACDAGMRDDILLADPASNRYVLWDGKLRILPHSIESAVLGDFLTWPGKIRAGLAVLRVEQVHLLLPHRLLRRASGYSARFAYRQVPFITRKLAQRQAPAGAVPGRGDRGGAGS